MRFSIVQAPGQQIEKRGVMIGRVTVPVVDQTGLDHGQGIQRPAIQLQAYGANCNGHNTVRVETIGPVQHVIRTLQVHVLHIRTVYRQQNGIIGIIGQRLFQ